jgi:hypothetical protein
LKHAEDLRGNLYDMFTHLYPFHPTGLLSRHSDAGP